MSDVKLIDYDPAPNDKRPQGSHAIELKAAERDYTFIVVTPDEKKEFVTNLKKVCLIENKIAYWLFLFIR